jgi:Plasmid stabilization system protein
MPKTICANTICQVDNTLLTDQIIREIVRFILDREGPDVAEAILDKFEEAKERLQRLPDRGRITPEMKNINVFSFRECQVPPYRMIYEIIESES